MRNDVLSVVCDRDRLASLRALHLLDSPATEAFDRLARLAARSLHVPMVFTSLVDENRQFFKSGLGLPEPWTSAREIPLSHSFCQYVVASHQPLVVGDARVHPLLHTNPAIHDLNIVAYLGIPLTMADGHTLGSFCVSDSVPRTWGQEDIDTLRDIAASVVSEIELHALRSQAQARQPSIEAAMQEKEQRLRLALRAGRMGIYDWDLATDTIAWSEEHAHLFGMELDDFDGRYQTYAQRVYPDDLLRINQALEVARTNRRLFQEELRIVWPDGSLHWVAAQGRFFYDNNGQALHMTGVVQDIDAHKRAENEAQLLAQRIKLATDSASIGVWDWDLKTDQWYATPTYFTMLGYDAEEGFSSRERWIERIHPEDREAVGKKIKAVLAGGNAAYQYEARIRHANGSYRWISVAGRVLAQDENNKASRMLGVRMDITEHKRAEEAWRTSEERLRLALDAAHMGSFDWDILNNRITWSRWHEELWGFKPGEFDGTYEAFSQRVHPDDLPNINAEVARCIAAHEPFAGEFRVVWPEGGIHWIAGRGEFTWDAHGQAVRMHGVVREITEHKQAEAALEQSEQRLRNLIDGLGPYMFVGLMTPQGKLIEANRPALAAASLTPEDVLGKPFEETYWWSYSQDVQQQLRLAITRAAHGEASRYDVQVRVAENRFIIIDFSLQPVWDQSGEVMFLVPSANVITERKQAEEALLKLTHELEQRVADRTAALADTNAELESFSYTVSHDLRAPLRAIQGLAQALQEDYADALDTLGRDYTQRLIAAAERMDKLIQDLLAYSRLTRADLKPETVDMGDVIEHACEQLATDIAQCHAIIKVQAPLPIVTAHPATLVQIMTNLIANAIKFVTPGVRPEINIRSERRDHGLRLWVEDNGIGIEAEHQERIFRVFERLHGIENYPGTGIGLAIIRKGAERMGGTAGVESALGQGSRFWIELPLDRSK